METETMIHIIHRVPDGSGTLTANCGAELGVPGHAGHYGPNPRPSTGEALCTAGCYPKHRAELTAEQIKLRDVSVPIVPARHRAEGVAA